MREERPPPPPWDDRTAEDQVDHEGVAIDASGRVPVLLGRFLLWAVRGRFGPWCGCGWVNTGKPEGLRGINKMASLPTKTKS
ncbi:hypothetical protein F2Q69_00027193 [Brassica cretica]|uniref:Uncharacterized protein n=1 Tax=Brassica cretica TaxID=69181 RepID=A0A8S9RXK0_BRACR|nr:hypothetical protein F2Q69_00027193 [Brassica cretica]